MDDHEPAPTLEDSRLKDVLLFHVLPHLWPTYLGAVAVTSKAMRQVIREYPAHLWKIAAGEGMLLAPTDPVHKMAKPSASQIQQALRARALALRNIQEDRVVTRKILKQAFRPLQSGDGSMVAFLQPSSGGGVALAVALRGQPWPWKQREGFEHKLSRKQFRFTWSSDNCTLVIIQWLRSEDRSEDGGEHKIFKSFWNCYDDSVTSEVHTIGSTPAGFSCYIHAPKLSTHGKFIAVVTQTAGQGNQVLRIMEGPREVRLQSRILPMGCSCVWGSRQDAVVAIVEAKEGPAPLNRIGCRLRVFNLDEQRDVYRGPDEMGVIVIAAFDSKHELVVYLHIMRAKETSYTLVIRSTRTGRRLSAWDWPHKNLPCAISPFGTVAIALPSAAFIWHRQEDGCDGFQRQMGTDPISACSYGPTRNVRWSPCGRLLCVFDERSSRVVILDWHKPQPCTVATLPQAVDALTSPTAPHEVYWNLACTGLEYGAHIPHDPNHLALTHIGVIDLATSS